MNKVLQTGICTFFILGAFTGVGKPTFSYLESRPNIILIFADDLGWADLPQYGYHKIIAPAGFQIFGDIKMPNLDRLSNEGTLFTNFYVAAPTCTPSRAGLVTGLCPSRTKMHAPIIRNLEFNAERGIPNYLDYNLPNIMKSLKNNGYKVGHFGKWHLGVTEEGDAPFVEKYGIDEYSDCVSGDNPRKHSTKIICDRTIDFIERNQNHPFYINVWLYEPHAPLFPSQEDIELYTGSDPNGGTYRDAMLIWYAVLTRMDRHIGRLLNTLDELKLTENTIVIFTSDNGPESSAMPHTAKYGGVTAVAAGPFRGIKRSLYEGGIREPFIIRWPDRVPDNRIDNESVIGAVDLFPTFCSLSGTEIPPGLDGEDVSEVFYGRPYKRKGPLTWEIRFPVYGRVNDMSPRLALRDGEWKFLMNPSRNRVELYNITEDPGEVDNMAKEYPDIVKEYTDFILEWYKTLPEGPVHPDAGEKVYSWPLGGRSGHEDEPDR
jgi:N-acetylgalactosamine-6-sulfatase